MRILHTSDLHIGKKLYSSDRIEEQKAFLQELSKVCEEEQIDIVLIAGDLFDTFNPSTFSMLFNSSIFLPTSVPLPAIVSKRTVTGHP